MTEGSDQFSQSWAPLPPVGESPQTSELPWALLQSQLLGCLCFLLNTVLWSLLLVPTVSLPAVPTIRVV